jgi:hypothetical protein
MESTEARAHIVPSRCYRAAASAATAPCHRLMKISVTKSKLIRALKLLTAMRKTTIRNLWILATKRGVARVVTEALLRLNPRSQTQS